MTASSVRAPLLLATWLVSGVAGAQGPSGDQTFAQSLFDQGVTLMEKGDFAAACPKLAESQRLDPAGGTLLNLGLCREGEGKLASAWMAYHAAISQAIKEGSSLREATARERIAALSDKISKLTVEVAPETGSAEGLEIKVDGTELRQPAWGVPSPIDSGDHQVVATATGKLPWNQTVRVERDGVVLRLAIPRLADAPTRPRISGVEARQIAPSPQRAFAFATGSVGVALLIAGSTVGVMALDRRSQSDSECPNDRCTQRGVDLNNQAKTLAWLSDIGIGLGAAALVTGFVLLFTAPKPAPPRSGWLVRSLGDTAASFRF